MFKLEVTTAGDRGSYATNALLFRTEDEALQYGTDLALRWTAVVDCRARAATADELESGSLYELVEGRWQQAADQTTPAKPAN